MTRSFNLFGAAVAVTLAASAGAAQAQDCMAVMSQKPELSALIGALGRTGVASLMQSPGSFTILASTNTAIDKVPVNLRTDVLGSKPAKDVDPMRGAVVVNAQIIDGRHLASEVRGLRSVAGGFGAVGRNQVEPAQVIQADLLCSKGVVHIVDNVLIRSRRHPLSVTSVVILSGCAMP